MQYRITLLTVLSLAGFACTLIAGISLERLNASTDAVSGWQYFVSVALPIIGSFCTSVLRFAIRFKFRLVSVAPAGTDTQNKTLIAIAAQVNELAGRGSTAKARELLSAIDIVTGAKST